MSLGYVPGLYNCVLKDKCTVAQNKNIYKSRIREKNPQLDKKPQKLKKKSTMKTAKGEVDFQSLSLELENITEEEIQSKGGEIGKVNQACQITEIFELHFLNYFKRE